MGQRKKPKPPPKPGATFPGGFMWGAVFAVAAIVLAYLGVPAAVRPAYITGVLAVMAVSLFGLSFEWRKAHLQQTSAADRFVIALGVVWKVFAVGSAGLGIAALTLSFLELAVPKTLIQEKPWAVLYGDILGDGKGRVYVHARFNNTATEPVKFQAYGKAVIEPPNLTREQSEQVSDELRDDARKYASGDDAPVQTINGGDDHTVASFDIPAKSGAKSEFDDWKLGKSVVYYATYVYVKDSDGARLTLKDCEITRSITKETSAGDIPGYGRVWVKYPWSEETPCDETGKH